MAHLATDFAGPDPLGEVRFDADPIFMATKDLREPYLAGPRGRHRGVHAIASKRARAQENVVWGGRAAVARRHHLGRARVHPLRTSRLEGPRRSTPSRRSPRMLVQLQARIDAEERTAYIALHDDLTDLPNRRALLRELKLRRDAARDTAVLIIDLDRFKVMNDFLGHANGDRLLITIADRIRTSIRVNDYCARLGGDEFVVLLDEANSEMEVLSSAYRILEVVAAPVDLGGQLVSHTASIGIAIADTGIERDGLGRARRRRRRHVRRQGARPQQGRDARREDARGPRRAFRHGTDVARGDGKRSSSAFTTSPRSTCARAAAVGRGAGALAAPDQGHDRRGRVHHRRRGDRSGARPSVAGSSPRRVANCRRGVCEYPESAPRRARQHVAG